MFCMDLYPTIILTNTPEKDAHVRPFMEVQEVTEIEHLFLTSLPGKLAAAAGSGPDAAQMKVICENLKHRASQRVKSTPAEMRGKPKCLLQGLLFCFMQGAKEIKKRERS